LQQQVCCSCSCCCYCCFWFLFLAPDGWKHRTAAGSEATVRLTPLRGAMRHKRVSVVTAAAAAAASGATVLRLPRTARTTTTTISASIAAAHHGELAGCKDCWQQGDCAEFADRPWIDGWVYSFLLCCSSSSSSSSSSTDTGTTTRTRHCCGKQVGEYKKLLEGWRAQQQQGQPLEQQHQERREQVPAPPHAQHVEHEGAGPPAEGSSKLLGQQRQQRRRSQESSDGQTTSQDLSSLRTRLSKLKADYFRSSEAPTPSSSPNDPQGPSPSAAV